MQNPLKSKSSFFWFNPGLTYQRMKDIGSLKLQIDLLVQALLDLDRKVLTNLRVRHRFIVRYVMFLRLSLLLSGFLVFHAQVLESVLPEESAGFRFFQFSG